MPDEPDSPMDRAIDAAEDRMRLADQLAPGARVAVVPMLVEAHAWDDNAEVTIGAAPGDMPELLIWDHALGAYRGIYLPDGSKWRVLPDRPALWTPSVSGAR